MLDKDNLNFLGPYLDNLHKGTTTIKAAGITGITQSQLEESKKAEIQKRFDHLMGNVIDTFNDTISKARQNYYLNVGISLTIVVFGCLLISLSIYFGLSQKQFEPLSAITAAIGVADFVSLFFISPQTKIRRLLGDLAQMEIIYTNWCLEAYLAYENLVSNGYTTESIQKFQEILKQVTTDSVKQIEDNIGNDPDAQTKGTDSQSNNTGAGNK